MKLLDPRGVRISVSDEFGAELLASARGYKRRATAVKAAAPAPAAPKRKPAPKPADD